MPMGTCLRTVQSRRGIIRSTVLLAVVAITVVMLLPSAFAQSIDKPSASVVGLASASASSGRITGAVVAQNQSSLTLPSPGALNLFGMATGGSRPTTGFASGNIVTATDKRGYVSAAIGVTQLDSNNYTTKDHYYSIGGVGVSGFKFYGEQTKIVVPPVQPTTTVTEKLVLPESALVVVVALSGGQTSIVLKGIPGFGILANGTGGTWSGILIGQAQLKAGTYTVKETTTNHDAGGTNRADALGIFAFSSKRSGFIDKGIIQVVTTIPVGTHPSGAAYDSAKGEIFIGNSYSNDVSVISDATNKVVTTIPVGNGGKGDHYGGNTLLTYDSGKGEVFVPNLGSNNVSVISTATNKVVATIAVGSQPYGTAYDSKMGEVFVSNSAANTVSVINDTKNKVVATITMGNGGCGGTLPFGLAYDSGKGEIFAIVNYADCSGSDYVSVISDATNTIVANISVGNYPYQLAYDHATGEIFVVNAGYFSASWATVSVINDATNEVVATIPVGPDYPDGVAYDSHTGDLFVSFYNTPTYLDANIVSAISDTTNRVIANVTVGSGPDGMAYDSGMGEVFVTNPDSNTVTVISDGTG
jgi:YVTN family beta-propeller protein